MTEPLPPIDIYQKAKQLKPDLPIMATSTWIAILHHDKTSLDEITDETDFLWIKCHKVCQKAIYLSR